HLPRVHRPSGGDAGPVGRPRPAVRRAAGRQLHPGLRPRHFEIFLYSGARLSTVCRLKVSDFHQDGDEATIRLHEKGDKRRTIGLHFQAAQAIREYIEKAELTSGPLFRPLLNPRSKKLANQIMDPATLYRLVEKYLQ